MLTRRRRARGALAALAVAAMLVVAYSSLDRSPDATGAGSEAVLGGSGEPRAASDTRAVSPEERRRVRRILDAAIEAGPRYDGEMKIALLLDGWLAPIVRATARGGARDAFRAWSVSKVITTVALLRRMGWADRAGAPLTAAVSEAMRRALVHSENCPQRRLTLELQRIAGGTPQSARSAIVDVLRDAGASGFRAARQAQPPEPLCTSYMEGASGVLDPNASALLAGTSTWTIGDAARFAGALRSGVYGRAVARRVLGTMRRPKQRSEEIQSIDFTAPLDWGVGAVFGNGEVAYKAGWGGTQHGAFVAEQVAIIPIAGGSWAALSIAFHPHVQPPRDDPGVTHAPAALAEAVQTVATGLDRDGADEVP